MVHQTLIATIVVGLGLAFVFGAVAHRLKIPLLIGYILAGVVIGPFTPGYVADQTLALQLAEVGVILLMFGVGLHFSLHDLLSVKAVAVPGAVGQMVLVSALGFGLAKLMGWSSGAGVVFGLALSVASTVVVLRAMQERRLVDTDRGRIILANPILFFALDKARPWLGESARRTRPATVVQPITDEELPVTSLRNHAVIIGCGRVGSLVTEAMMTQGEPLLVIEERGEVVDKLRTRGIEAIAGNAAQPGILKAANLSEARWFISAIPNPFENGNLIEQARAANPKLEIIARAHSDDEVQHLRKYGADLIIMGEREIARGITEHIARRLREAGPRPKN